MEAIASIFCFLEKPTLEQKVITMTIMTFFYLLAGFVLLIGGAELLVRGASNLALAVGISPLVIGLTVVAYGTGAPEVAVSLQSGFAGVTDIAVGNVVGSNIANILLILGVSAIIAPLAVSSQLVRFEVPLMIGASVLVWIMGLDGRLSTLEGAILMIGGVSYTGYAIWQSRREGQAAEDAEDDATTEQVPNNALTNAQQVGFMVVGLAMLVMGANWLVASATVIAQSFGVSELIIGLTIVAIGTSLPELATSIIAGFKGERDIAVGNAIGSNIFNVLIVLGLTASIAPDGVEVLPAATNFDLPIMIAVAFACLPIFFTGKAIDRWEGWLFFGYYVAYLLYLGLAASEHAVLPVFNTAMLFFVVPLTVITIAISVWQQVQPNTTQSSA